MHWRRKWQPTPVFLPGESQGWQSLGACCLWGCTVGHDWSDSAAAAAAAAMCNIRWTRNTFYIPYLTGSSSNSMRYIREYLLYRIKKKLNLILQWYLRSAIMTPILKCCVLSSASMAQHFFFLPRACFLSVSFVDSLYLRGHLIFKVLKPVPRSFCFVPIIISLVHFTTWRISKFSLGLYILVLSYCCSLMSDSLQLHGLQHARLPCPSQSFRVCSNSCPSRRWCHSTISSLVTPLSFCPQSFPASGTFPLSQLLASGGQSIGASTSTSVLSMNIQGWLPLGLTGLISLQSKGLPRVFSKNLKASILQCSALFMVQLSYP